MGPPCKVDICSTDPLQMQLEELTNATCVLHASASDTSRILICTHRAAALWDATGDSFDILCQLPQHVQLVLAHDYHKQTCMLVAQHPEHLTCSLVFLSLVSGLGTEQVLDHPEDSSTTVSAAVPPCASRLITTKHDFTCTHAAVSLYQGWVHTISAYEWQDPHRRQLFVSKHSICATVSDQHLTGRQDAVLSMAFMPTKPNATSALLACLVIRAGVSHANRVVQCVEVQLPSGKTDTFSRPASSRPWLVRNVQPSTALLDSTDVTDSPQQGVLLFSSQSVLLLQPDANEATLLVQLQLTGVPIAVAHVGKARWAVTDSMAGLCIVDLQQPSCVCRVTTDTPLSVANALFPLPSDLLLLASQTGASQLIALPITAVQEPASAPPSAAPTMITAEVQTSARQPESPPACSMPTSMVAAVSETPFASNPGPIHDAIVFQGPQGCGESSMVMACGIEPRGCLRLAHKAAALQADITQGPLMPGAPHLIAVKADWQQTHHAYLAFSFASTGSTSLMDIQGTHFQPSLLPGLDPNAPSLLLQAVPGGFLVQVTPKEIRVLGEGGLMASQMFDSSLSLAACWGSSIAVATGACAQILKLDTSSGMLQAESSSDFSQQISALAVIELPSDTGKGDTRPWLAVGQWTEDEIMLQPLSGTGPACRLSCGEAGQPRSILAAEMHSVMILFIGTSLGWVVMHHLVWNKGHVQGGVGHRVHAGMSPVHLSWLPPNSTRPGCVYAQSSKALLLRPAPCKDISGQAHKAVEAVRVHGGEGLQAAVPVHTEDLPDSLAWLSPTEQLTFGRLDHQVKLRWHTLGVDDTPKHVAYHSSSGYAATLSSSTSGASCLRLIDTSTLRQTCRLNPISAAPITKAWLMTACYNFVGATGQLEKQHSLWAPSAHSLVLLPASTPDVLQVAAVGLEAGHRPTAICPAHLPCSSVAALHSLPGPAAPEKEFLLVATCTHSTDAAARQDAQQGFLSVFEVCLASGSQHSSPRSEVKLHGVCQLVRPCFSMAAADAPHAAAAATADVGTTCQSHQRPQVVLTGCEGQVLAYSLTVDDTAQTAHRALATALKALSLKEAMPPVSCPDCAPTTSTSAQKEAAAGHSDMHQLAETCIQRLSDPHWNQAVHLHLLCQASTARNTGLVTGLSVRGTNVLACSYMISLTVLTIQQRSDQVRLEAVSAYTRSLNHSAGPQPDAVAASSAIKPDLATCPVQAAVLMDDKLVLASLYPNKLLLLRRDRAEEMAVLDARHSKLLMQSSGHSSQLDTHQESTADGDMDRDALGLAELSFVAACTTSQSPEHLFQAEVGIQCSEIAHAENSCPASRSNADTNANRSATAVTPAGLVVAVGLDRPSS